MKYFVQKEAVHEGKIVTYGTLVEGKDLDKTYPAIFRKASATESLSKAEAQAIFLLIEETTLSNSKYFVLDRSSDSLRSK